MIMEGSVSQIMSCKLKNHATSLKCISSDLISIYNHVLLGGVSLEQKNLKKS